MSQAMVRMSEGRRLMDGRWRSPGAGSSPHCQHLQAAQSKLVLLHVRLQPQPHSGHTLQQQQARNKRQEWGLSRAVSQSRMQAAKAAAVA